MTHYKFTMQSKKFYENKKKYGFYLIQVGSEESLTILYRNESGYKTVGLITSVTVPEDAKLIFLDDVSCVHEEEKDRNRYKEIKDKWNALVDWSHENFEGSRLKHLTKMSSTRKRHLDARLREPDFDFDKIVEMIKKSKFLQCGDKNGKFPNWRLRFSWLIENDSRYIGIIEGEHTDIEDDNEDIGDQFKIVT